LPDSPTALQPFLAATLLFDDATLLFAATALFVGVGASANWTLLLGLAPGLSELSYSYHTPLIFLFNFLGGGLIRPAITPNGIGLATTLPASDMAD
jgi:hypothetical protein